MKKISCLVAVLMLFLSSLAYAEGGQNCGDNAKGTAGTEAQGDAEAQYWFGRMYLQKKGVHKNIVEGEKWIRISANQGCPKAQNHLGVLYYTGDIVSQSDEQAVEWFRKAAEQGDADGQNNLGMMYDLGRGVPADKQEALKWYSKALEQGHISAAQKWCLLQPDIKNNAPYNRGLKNNQKAIKALCEIGASAAIIAALSSVDNQSNTNTNYNNKCTENALSSKRIVECDINSSGDVRCDGHYINAWATGPLAKCRNGIEQYARTETVYNVYYEGGPWYCDTKTGTFDDNLQALTNRICD